MRGICLFSSSHTFLHFFPSLRQCLCSKCSFFPTPIKRGAVNRILSRNLKNTLARPPSLRSPFLYCYRLFCLVGFFRISPPLSAPFDPVQLRVFVLVLELPSRTQSLRVVIFSFCSFLARLSPPPLPEQCPGFLCRRNFFSIKFFFLETPVHPFLPSPFCSLFPAFVHSAARYPLSFLLKWLSVTPRTPPGPLPLKSQVVFPHLPLPLLSYADMTPPVLRYPFSGAVPSPFLSVFQDDFFPRNFF